MRPLIQFDSFRFDPANARLWRDDAEIRLTRKAALVLGELLANRGEPVSKQALFATVWRGTVVSDDALVTCIQELRKALGDHSRQPVYIETRHRLGYRFAAPITEAVRSPDGAAALRAQTPLDPHAIAVLPFKDMSAARDQDHLCEGLAEELIDALTHVEGLEVAARTSSFVFRGGHDLREVGRALGVGSLLEGSVRKSGDRLRITVQLIDVASGFHRWSERFERSATDVFAVQDEIAETVAKLLRGDALNARERRAMHRRPTVIETYECFLRGRQRMHAWQQPHMDEAREFYERALELDAGYAPAWAGLAMLHALLYEWWGAQDEHLAQADRASRMAMQLAPELADAHLARAYALSNMGRYADACEHFEAATRVNPSLFDAYYYYGRAAFAAGDTAKSIELWHRGAEVRRDDCECPFFEAQALRKLGRHDEARPINRESIRRAERLLELNPLNARVLSLIAGALVYEGQPRRALEWATRAEQLYPDDMAVVINSALIRTQLGLKQEALDRLEHMLGKGWGKKAWIENDPDYDPLRAEPRFKALLVRLRE